MFIQFIIQIIKLALRVRLKLHNIYSKNPTNINSADVKIGAVNIGAMRL